MIQSRRGVKIGRSLSLLPIDKDRVGLHRDPNISRRRFCLGDRPLGGATGLIERGCTSGACRGMILAGNKNDAGRMISFVAASCRFGPPRRNLAFVCSIGFNSFSDDCVY